MVIAISSCTSKPSDKVDDFLMLDSVMKNYPSLSQFTSFCVSRKQINGIPVCDSLKSRCRLKEKNYTGVLNQIGVPVNDFDSIVEKLCKIGFKTYYRHGNYSIWVENGAFGDIYGYLINHNP